MTSIWVAEHGWCYLNAAIDCCTREITAWALDVRCRAQEAVAVIDHALATRELSPGSLTLGTDNGTAFTSRPLRARLAELGVTHRRGGYRDPREPGLHRVLVLQAQTAPDLARRIRHTRSGARAERRLRRALPRPAALGPELPHAARSRGHLATSPRRPNTGGPKRQRRRVQAPLRAIPRLGIGAMDGAHEHTEPVRAANQDADPHGISATQPDLDRGVRESSCAPQATQAADRCASHLAEWRASPGDPLSGPRDWSSLARAGG